MTVLVVYASKHGSTEGIAQGIAERLRERGKQAEARPVEDVTDLGSPEAVILGSAVYMGSWMKEAKAFVEHNREALSRVPVWLFSSGPIGDAAEAQAKGVGVSPKQLDELRVIGPRDHRLFPGVLDAAKLGFLERKMAKAIKAPEGDFRDWDEIRAFADEIADAPD